VVHESKLNKVRRWDAGKNTSVGYDHQIVAHLWCNRRFDSPVTKKTIDRVSK
jgi:hypothetical protein